MFFTCFIADIDVPHTVEIVKALVAGPANRKTNAALGESPLSNKDAAIGVEDVAQTYMRTLITNIKNIEKN